MIAEMQKAEEERKATNGAASDKLDSILKKKKKAEDRNVSTKVPNAGADWDWTNTYRSWDGWEDLEDIQVEEDEERKKLKHAQMRTSCDHDHSAV